jgi:anti-sigma regulatory factor (Ser/Thr protein kinase)
MPDDARAETIRFIINELDLNHATTVVGRAAVKFGISRQAVQQRVNSLIKEGALEAHGNTRARKYSLKSNYVLSETIPVAGLEEDVVYRERVAPLLQGVPDNLQKICNYGFTEMLNNVVDHSESASVSIWMSRTSAVIEFDIIDYGIGIFKKIKNALNLDDERQSLLELSKGKMTTNPAKHTGEGIFFTSRAFDHFSLVSSGLFFWHRTDHDDWLVEDRSFVGGTGVKMRICTHSPTQLKDVFHRFSTPNREHDFSRTHVPLALAQYGENNLVSRSQAKRVLGRFDQFEEVLLDFDGVRFVGQAFADEVFRVFRRENPTIKLHWIRANSEVEGMIHRALHAHDVERAAAAQTAKRDSPESSPQ